MEESDKHKLEGLLKARSHDMGQGRRSRARRPVSDAATVTEDQAPPATGSGRTCAECGGEISPRRLRAMPRATRCLGCQRAAEAAGAHS